MNGPQIRDITASAYQRPAWDSIINLDGTSYAAGYQGAGGDA